MDIKAAAQSIKDAVNMEQILDFYGYEAKHGFINCPFHPGDRDASLKVYKGSKGWHCFGCGKGGSVIDFVMEQEGCDFRTAAYAIDQAFSLGFLSEKVNPHTEDRERMFQRALDRIAETLTGWCDGTLRNIRCQLDLKYRHLKELEDLRDEDPQELTAEDWTFLHTWTDDAQDLELRAMMVERTREEVTAWRRTHMTTKVRSV